MTDGFEAPYWGAEPTDPALTLAAIDRWVCSPAMGRLVSAFGGSISSRAPDALLDYLDAFSALHWDFRGGRERNLGGKPAFIAAQRSVAESAAIELGLDLDTPPRSKAYDFVILTGGMVRAGIVKPRYARELVDGGLRTGEIVFLGAFRPFAGDEADTARGLGVTGSDEYDAMIAGLAGAFGPLAQPQIAESISDNRYESWARSTWGHGGVRLTAMAAAAPAPHTRRANTADTLRFWAGQAGLSAVSGGASPSVLVVTTPIYVPYQGAVAVEVLGLEYGLKVETVAVGATASDLGRLTQRFSTAHKLQEIRSAIRAFRNLRRKLGYLAGPVM